MDKKILNLILAVLIIIAIGTFLPKVSTRISETFGSYQILDVQKLTDAQATTSPVYIFPNPNHNAPQSPGVNPSSTLVVKTGNANAVRFNFYLDASTTSEFIWTYGFTNDTPDITSSTTLEVDTEWYYETGDTDTSDVLQTYGTTKQYHTITPGIDGITDFSILYENPTSEWMRIDMGSRTATSTIYVEAITLQKVE